MLIRLVAPVILMILVCDSQAQFAAPIKDSLTSTVLGEQRNLEIILPDHYGSDTSHYDVWYVLDGEWNTHTFTNIFSFLIAIQFAPPAIIVSVPNRYVNGFNLRDRDLTPTKWGDVDSSGGADHFLAFFERELMPYVNKKYRVSGESGLFGSSFGGVFTFYALLERPSLFRFYTTADPALHFDGQYIPRLAAEKLKNISFSNTVLSIGGRNGVSYHAMARDMMDSILRAAAPAGLHWHSALYENETHGSSVFKSNYDGLKYAYLGYFVRNARFHLTGGIVLKDRPIRLFIPTDNADMRYTMDGAKPARNSAIADDHLIISDPSKLRAASFSPSGRYDHEIPMRLTAGDYLSAKKMSRANQSQPKLTLQSRIINGQMKGFVNIPKDGYYVLQLTPSEGTQLYFNDSLWVRYDPQRGHARETVILPLRKGDYVFRLKHPSANLNDPPLNFGLYFSENGQDDWWTNPLLRN